MFTLQILDRGQTSLFPLADRPVVVGSGPEADLRLGEDEVVAVHARIEPVADGWRLQALAKVLVNGRAVQSAPLALGDRIEIGAAVLLVGTAVARNGRPEDVLAEPGVRARRSPGSVPRRSGKLLPLLGAALVLGAVGYFVLQGGSDSSVRGLLRDVERLQAQLRLDEADALAARLRGEWRDTTDDRLAQLAAIAARSDAIRARTEAIRGEILDPAVERSYADWRRELQRREEQGDEIERAAARLAAAKLRDTYERRPPSLARGTASPEQPAPADGATVDAPTRAADAASWLEAAERFAGEGLFAQALNAIDAGLGEAGSADEVARLQRARAGFGERADAAMRRLLEQADGLVAGGNAREAVTLLAGARHRWPSTEAYAPIGRALRDAEAAVAAVAPKRATTGPVAGATRPIPMRSDTAPGPAPDAVPAVPEAAPAAGQGVPDAVPAPPGNEAVRIGTLAELRTRLDAIGAAEQRGDFAAAATGLHEAAALVRDRDPDFAARLAVRAAEAGWLAAWHDAVAAALAGGRGCAVRLRGGAEAELVGIDEARLVLAGAAAPAAANWSDLDAASLQRVLEHSRPTGSAALGAATLLYRAGDATRAEAALARLLQADPAQKPDVDRVLARGRDEPLDPRGYTLEKGAFVSARAMDVKRLAKTLASDLDAALRSKDVAQRAAFLQKTMALGPEAIDALRFAVNTRFVEQVGRLEASGLRKQVEQLVVARAELDKAREHARSLIYDEVRYFYPYKPPAVSPERFAEYNRVQAEVDRRVASLRDLWHSDAVHVRVPASLRADLDRLDWLARTAAELGDAQAVAAVDIGWAQALPAGESIGLQQFCRDVGERQDLDEWQAIEAYNREIEKRVPSAVKEQLRITNAYRAMFRHRPLALVPKVCLAAQGHADEMSKLGYFAHMSPTPGRKTPFDRMKLAGYAFGVTENIALVDSAQGAHDAWCRSSGHHRNLLDPQHREFGIGANGRYWVQNFGSGSTYLDETAYRTANAAGRKR